MPEFKDYAVQCSNPEALDRTIQQLGNAMLHKTDNGYQLDNGYYRMRVVGNPDYIKFFVDTRGYGKIIKEL